MTVAVDSSGNANNGSYVGTSALVAGGLLPAGGDAARNFNVGGVFPNGTGHVGLPLVVPDWTLPWALECWGQSLTPGEPWLYMVEFQGITPDGDGSWVCGQAVPGNDGFLRWIGFGDDVITPNVVNMCDGTPKYVVVTSDGTSIRMYIDAVLVVTQALSGFTFTDTCTEVQIASNVGNPSECRGILDEFAIYTAGLSAGQVSAHFAAGSVSFAAYTAAVLADAPISYYHLNDATGGWHVGQVGLSA